MWEVISSEIPRIVLEKILVIFGSVKEEFWEILDECFGAFCAEVMSIFEARTLSFRELRACGAPVFHREMDPIVSRS